MRKAQRIAIKLTAENFVSAIFVPLTNDFLFFFSVLLIFHDGFVQWKYQHIVINKSMACSASMDIHIKIAVRLDYILMMLQNIVPSKMRPDADHWPPVSIFIFHFLPDLVVFNIFLNVHTSEDRMINCVRSYRKQFSLMPFPRDCFRSSSVWCLYRHKVMRLSYFNENQKKKKEKNQMK